MRALAVTCVPALVAEPYSVYCEFAERRKFYTEYVHFWPVFGIRWNTIVFHSPRAARMFSPEAAVVNLN